MIGSSRRAIIVQDRDRELLRELAVLRVIDRDQAKQVAGFNSTTRANARLLALHRAGLLKRFFLGTVGGARKALYAASPKGAALVGVPCRGPRRSENETLLTDFFTTHQLATNDVLLAARRGLQSEGSGKFIRWETFNEPLVKAIPLIPDGYVEVRHGSNTFAAFLEVDLGHETKAVWRKKVEHYVRYALLGEFPKRFRHPRFRVLVVAPSDRRVLSLRGATAEVTEKIFFFATLAAIRQKGFWASVWQRPRNPDFVALMENI